MKVIMAPEDKSELEKFFNDVSYEITGKEVLLDEARFSLFWKSNIIMDFYKKTGIFIDDFETSIISDDLQVEILKEIVDKSRLGFSGITLKNELISLIEYACKRKSGVIFFF